jgi:hypothetical protein
VVLKEVEEDIMLNNRVEDMLPREMKDKEGEDPAPGEKDERWVIGVYRT